MTKATPPFANKLLRWFDAHGRHDLPWQQNITPYRVWVSEIMLQQTQVATVIPYYLRFMQTFPTLDSLANGSEDDVMHHWSGLGYYSRARNLHKTAKIIQKEYQSNFPSTQEDIEALPGIGKSTAGAILSIAHNRRAPILDGNVKRVLARFHTIDGWYGHRETLNKLWHYAEQYTPTKRVADYTQAIMDLGATICTRSQPKCDKCPLNTDCFALKSKNPTQWPHKKPKKANPSKITYLLVLINQSGAILLEKRPPQGIWGSLWSLPEFSTKDQIEQKIAELNPKNTLEYPEISHKFSHFTLIMQPIICTATLACQVMEDDRQVWYNSAQHSLGLPAPIKTLINQLEREL